MMQCLALSVATGELAEILAHPELYWTDIKPMFVVLISGFFSFTLNVTSFMTNKMTSPLTLCIAGNVKQVLMIAISTIIFSTPITVLNGSGIVVVLVGSCLYSYISLTEKNQGTGQQTLAESLPLVRGTDDEDSSSSKLELGLNSNHLLKQGISMRGFGGTGSANKV